MPANTVKVERSTRWGNPCAVGEPIDMRQARRWGWDISPDGRAFVCETAEQAVGWFAYALNFDEAIWPTLRAQLRGKNLACWCAIDQPCHADVLLEIANAPDDGDGETDYRGADGHE